MTTTISDSRRKHISQQLSNIYHLSFNPSIEPFFSWSPCETCSSHLGGDRYILLGKMGQSKHSKTIVFECCVDCFSYLSGF